MKLYENGVSASGHTNRKDMEKAALHGAALMMHNPHLISVRAVHERNVNPVRNIQAGKTHHKIPFFISAGNLEGSRFGN
jgi:hypothetical protein